LAELRIKKAWPANHEYSLMKEASFAVLKREGEKIVGWGGLDLHFQEGYPELFSLYLDPAYRRFSLGLLIESVSCVLFRFSRRAHRLCSYD